MTNERYTQCPVTLDVDPRIRCVMFAGHRPLSPAMGLVHNLGGLGPYTPGMDPVAYIESGNTYLPEDEKESDMKEKNWQPVEVKPDEWHETKWTTEYVFEKIGVPFIVAFVLAALVFGIGSGLGWWR